MKINKAESANISINGFMSCILSRNLFSFKTHLSEDLVCTACCIPSHYIIVSLLYFTNQNKHIQKYVSYIFISINI